MISTTAPTVARRFEHEAAAAGQKARVLEERGAQQLSREIAKGAPRHTGAYASSWHGDHSSASSSSPQAARLERGFHRVDSLGRRYDQPAFPHIGPAVNLFTPVFAEQVAAVVADALR